MPRVGRAVSAGVVACFGGGVVVGVLLRSSFACVAVGAVVGGVFGVFVGRSIWRRGVARVCDDEKPPLP